MISSRKTGLWELSSGVTEIPNSYTHPHPRLVTDRLIFGELVNITVIVMALFVC